MRRIPLFWEVAGTIPKLGGPDLLVGRFANSFKHQVGPTHMSRSTYWGVSKVLLMPP